MLVTTLVFPSYIVTPLVSVDTRGRLAHDVAQIGDDV